MKRMGFTLIEIMIVVLILGVLVAIASPYFLHARQRTQATVCINGLRVIADAKEQWALEWSKSSGDEPEKWDLTPDYIKRYPICPVGTEAYLIMPIDDPPECPNVMTYIDHVLPNVPAASGG